MASSETPPPSTRQGVGIVPSDSDSAVPEVLLAVGEQVGHDTLCFASRMNKAVVVFLKDEPQAHLLIESGVFIRDRCPGFPAVSTLQADHCVRCSAVHTERAARERAPEVWEIELRMQGPEACSVSEATGGDGHYMVCATAGKIKVF